MLDFLEVKRFIGDGELMVLISVISFFKVNVKSWFSNNENLYPKNLPKILINKIQLRGMINLYPQDTLLLHALLLKKIPRNRFTTNERNERNKKISILSSPKSNRDFHLIETALLGALT